MTSLAGSDTPIDAASASTAPVVAILAGPGSGKTRALCDRARVLLQRHPDDSALLLTYMNKAAAEMKARALDATGVSSERLRASTYHTFALHLLETHGELVGIDQIDVLDAVDQEELVAELVVLHGLNEGRRFKRWHGDISAQRLRDIPLEGDLRRLNDAYEARKRELGSVDFDDLIVFAADLLTEHPQIAESWGLRFSHLLIDEFQDTNAAQFRIVRALARYTKTVTVVADDDQAIMRFAGADAGNVHAFVSELGAEEHHLTLNHRCRARIVEAANRLIAHDPFASGRQMTAKDPDGEVAFVLHNSPEEEACWLVEDVQRRLDDGAMPHDLAVLAPRRTRAEHVLAALRSADLPVSDWLTVPGRDPARAYLTACLAFLRASLSPRLLRQAHELLGFTGEECATQALLEANAGNATATALLELREEAFQGMRPSAMVVRIVELVRPIDPKQAGRIAAIADEVAAFEQYDPEYSPQHLLDHLALGMPSHGAPTGSSGIKLSTLHRTKGLEWPHVWIVGLEEDTLPFFAARTAQEVGDARRALFVGICRARDSVTLCGVEFPNGNWYKPPSRFLAEIRD